MSVLFVALWPVIFLCLLFVGGVHLVAYILRRFFGG